MEWGNYLEIILFLNYKDLKNLQTIVNSTVSFIGGDVAQIYNDVSKLEKIVEKDYIYFYHI
uniref:Uncharacterized protein n=1 Tax=Strongyloides papillosus TaxID=174720 RepID=A0A0N5BJ17_STREA